MAKQWLIICGEAEKVCVWCTGGFWTLFLSLHVGLFASTCLTFPVRKLMPLDYFHSYFLGFLPWVGRYDMGQIMMMSHVVQWQYEQLLLLYFYDYLSLLSKTRTARGNISIQTNKQGQNPPSGGDWFCCWPGAGCVELSHFWANFWTGTWSRRTTLAATLRTARDACFTTMQVFKNMQIFLSALVCIIWLMRLFYHGILLVRWSVLTCVCTCARINVP